MTAAVPVLDVRSVSVRFAGLRALTEVDLQIGEREIVSLIGPNGAGKTTLLNAVCGLVAPSQGEVRLRGRSLLAAGLRRLRSRASRAPSSTPSCWTS
jgi:branched-chain amino acid transport system ATP-binding protein